MKPNKQSARIQRTPMTATKQSLRIQRNQFRNRLESMKSNGIQQTSLRINENHEKSMIIQLTHDHSGDVYEPFGMHMNAPR